MRLRLRHILLTLAIATLSMASFAETVSRKEALRIAEKFFNAAAGQVMAQPKLIYNGKKLTTDRLFSPFYIYNHPVGGSVIISADNKAMPILGYSLKSNFSPDHIDPEIEKLLSEYAKDIEYIRYDSRMPVNAIDAWTDIAATIDYSLNRIYGDSEWKRIENDDEVWIMRGNATEFPGVAQKIQDDDDNREEEEEEPFTFYDTFIAETRAEQQRRLDMFDSRVNITEPKLRWIGGGHFEVVLPEQVTMVRLYNMEGALIRELTYRNTDTAVFDLDSEPRGFYFALVNDVNGRPYGFKLYK